MAYGVHQVILPGIHQALHALTHAGGMVISVTETLKYSLILAFDHLFFLSIYMPHLIQRYFHKSMFIAGLGSSTTQWTFKSTSTYLHTKYKIKAKYMY